MVGRSGGKVKRLYTFWGSKSACRPCQSAAESALPECACRGRPVTAKPHLNCVILTGPLVLSHVSMVVTNII